MENDIISDLEASMQRKLSTLPEKIRLFTKDVPELPKAFILTGPRGVGKTTFLLYHAVAKDILYLSADNPLLSAKPLYEIISSIFSRGYKGVIIDEVHFASDWSLHVKALYDDFPKRKIWISDSSSLVLRIGGGDISRRFVSIKMPLLSFREFLHLETGEIYPVFDPFFNKGPLPVLPVPEILQLFQSYKKVGTRPFYLEGNFVEKVLAILDKTLYFDIPFFLSSITDGNLRLMKAITGTLVKASVPRLQVRSLCNDWSIGADKLYQLLNVMESVDLLRIVRFENDTKAKTAGQKLLFFDPILYSVLNGEMGTLREAMVATLCSYSGGEVYASKDESVGDFIVKKDTSDRILRVSIEVGGRSKKHKKSDFVIRDDIDYPASGVIPLWLLGMMY